MQKYIIPKKDVLVRDPQSFNPLPVEGTLVDWNGKAGRFWRRRVRCGDVTIVKQETKEEPVEIDDTAEPLQSKRKQRSK